MGNLDKTPVRFVTVKDNTYLRTEDIVNLLREFASTEETDTRNRLEELARNLDCVGTFG